MSWEREPSLVKKCIETLSECVHAVVSGQPLGQTLQKHSTFLTFSPSRVWLLSSYLKPVLGSSSPMYDKLVSSVI